MNSKLRTQIFIAGFAVVLIGFGAGYVAGTHSFSFSQIQASEQVDLSPFWKVWNTLDEKFVSASTTQQLTSEEKLYGAISGLVNSMGDPYTVFFTPEKKEDFDQAIEGTFSGVGMEVGIQDDYLTVVSPLKNSPAQKAGIMPGDKIVSIDGTDATDLKVEEAVDLIRGPIGTTVVIKILRPGSDGPENISIVRENIVVPTLETKIEGDVFIISLYTFGTNATAEFRQAMRDFTLSKKQKLILDLRGNPGGYLEAAVDISSYFLPAGKVVVSEDFGPKSSREQQVFRSRGYNVFGSSKKMIVLIDKGSASASEIVAGALQEQGVAKLVGEQSFGKGSVQELVNITSDTALKVTIARWLTPNGNSISNGGLTPDVPVEFDTELYKKEKKDNQLIKAIQLLNQ